MRATDLIHPLRRPHAMRAKYTGTRCVPALQRAERNLCRNDNVHNCLFRENNRFHHRARQFATLWRRCAVVFGVEWARKKAVSQTSRGGNNTARCILAAISLSVGLCVCGALKIRANDRRACSVSFAPVTRRACLAKETLQLYLTATRRDAREAFVRFPCLCL